MQQNQASFCFAEDFDPAVCTFDNGIYCPNRCGVCAVTVAPQAPVLQLPMLIAGDVAQFDRVGFRDKMARSLRISPDQVTVAVTPGSVLAVSTISTTSGSAEELAALEASATATFSSAAAASELLGVQVETAQPVTTVEVEVAEEPRAPPLPPGPNAPPPPEKGVNVGLLVALIAGAALLVAGLVAWMSQPAERVVTVQATKASNSSASSAPLLKPDFAQFTFRSLSQS